MRPRLPRALARSALLAALALGGCFSWTDKLNTRDVPSFTREWGVVKIDTAASEIDWRAEVITDNAYQSRVREDLARALETVFNGVPSSSASTSIHTTPARYKLTINMIESNILWMIIPCFVYFTILGCPFSHDSATVEIDIQVDNQIYSSRGTGGAFRGFYYNNNPFDFEIFSRRSDLKLAAVGDAIQEALKALQRDLATRQGAQ
ncbi:MAG: hypothetical protein FJ138_19120 [Deltaproteobacteria bacterium]|nr:hypothetical protein [Deltaproteobacteria bacterium]